MRLVVTIFDQRAAYRERIQSGAYVSKSAVAGDDLASLDTHTGLPRALEDEVLSRYPNLEQPLLLPQDVWSDLSKPTSFVNPSADLHDLRAGADSGRSASLNAQAPSFTPGQSSAPKRARGISETIKPVFAPLRSLDWRFGFIELDYFEAPVRMNCQRQFQSPQNGFAPLRSPQQQSCTLELPAIFEKRARSATGSDADVQPDSPSRRTSSGAGTIDLGFGVIHLYKDDEEEDLKGNRSTEDFITSNPVSHENRDRGSSLLKSKDEAVCNAGEGSMVAILGVPSNWTTADFLAFIDDSVNNLYQMRIMRDALPNRYMVLLKFHTEDQAKRFRKSYDGRPYSDMLLDEVCHVVRITSVEITSSGKAPYTFAFPMSGPEYMSDIDREAGKLELPTCPVCLERMDSSLTGLITVQCSHTFHCMCLKGWAANNCPVCRYSQGRSKSDKAWMAQQSNSCAVCSNYEHLWMCLICGHVGCGRFSGRHAHAHFEETGHTFAYELDSQRVWDYAGDQYVHRLIQSKTDGKMVELPSSAASGPGYKEGPHGAAGDEIAKIEAISIEFSDLLTMQLDSQRAYYAEKVNKLKEELSSAVSGQKSAQREADSFKTELAKLRLEQSGFVSLRETEEAALRSRLKILEEEVVPNLEKDRTRLEKKFEKASELSRALHKDLSEERSVTRGLMDNVSKLKDENDQRKTESESLKGEMADLKEQIQDLMFTLTAQERIKEEGGVGGSVQVQPKATPARRRKK